MINIGRFIAKQVPGTEILKEKSGPLYTKRFILKFSKEHQYGMIWFGSTHDKNVSVESIDKIIVSDDSLRPYMSFYLKDSMSPKDKNILFGILIGKTSPAILKNYAKEKVGLVKEGIGDNIKAGLELLGPGGILAIVSFMFFIYFWIRKAIKTKEEFQADKLDEELNHFLFKGQQGEDSAFELYANLVSNIKSVVRGQKNGIIINGPTGTGKTYVVRRTLYFENLKYKQDYIIVKGSTLSLSSFYGILYKYKDRLLVLDDFDMPLQNPETVNLLKAALDTYPIRILSLPEDKKISRDSDSSEEMWAPEKFRFSGKIIIITNLKTKDLDLALVGRTGVTNVEFNAKQFIELFTKMLQYVEPQVPIEIKVEVLNYIISHHKPGMIIDFRTLTTAINARITMPEDWTSLVDVILQKGKKY